MQALSYLPHRQPLSPAAATLISTLLGSLANIATLPVQHVQALSLLNVPLATLSDTTILADPAYYAILHAKLAQVI